MTDQQGHLVGLIVDSDRKLTVAIPVDRLMDIKDTFKKWGVPAIEWLGIKGRNSPTGETVLTAVAEGGPADRADLKPGDTITAIDGTLVTDWHHLVHLIRQSGTGTTVEVSIERHRKAEIIIVTVGSRSSSPEGDVAFAMSTAKDDE